MNETKRIEYSGLPSRIPGMITLLVLAFWGDPDLWDALIAFILAAAR